MARDRLYPLNTTDMLLAQMLTLMANVNRDTKKRSRPYHMLDFLPDPFEQRTTAEQERRAIAEVQRKLRENYAARERSN
jgi:hypothetical protein